MCLLQQNIHCVYQKNTYRKSMFFPQMLGKQNIPVRLSAINTKQILLLAVWWSENVTEKLCQGKFELSIFSRSY